MHAPLRLPRPRPLAAGPLAVLLLGLSVAGCKPLDYGPKSAYEATVEDLQHNHGVGGLTGGVAERIAGRMDDVVAMYEKGEIETAEDKLYACALLCKADDPPTIELAKELGHQAAEEGRDDALPFVAYATDKLLLKAGLPQRYGTQYTYVVILGKWRHYAVDPLTTDDERRAMGLPSLKEMREYTDVLNGSELTTTLGGDGE